MVYARIVAEKLGIDMSEPTTLLCDAESALRVANGEAAAARLRHQLRRAAIVHERVRMGEISLAHVPDVANAVDIFTKWTSQEKLETMLAYLTGGSSRRGATDEGGLTAALAVTAPSIAD